VVHGFEPGSTGIRTITVRLNNSALGADIGKRAFFENSLSLKSSFLPLGPDGWGQIVDERKVSIDTIENYCMRNRISSIDLLKSDTQGFDLT
jgi:hypothetical protein